MSPAPVRQRTTTERFPHAWGYALGLVLVTAGIGVAVWGVVTGITGFASDVNDLRRVIDGSALEQSLEAGEEVIVYDEADFNAGPFDVTVVRTSDGAVVPTTSIVDGVDYDVDGNSGRARVGFRVPTSDIYRVEVDTSVGQVARFAIGGDVGNNRTSRIIQGVTIGAVLAIAGLIAMVWTLILHARWRVRHAVLDRVQRTRATVTEATEAVSTSTQEARVAEAADRGAGWARERIDEARARLEADGDHGSTPAWRRRATDEARRRLDQADSALSSLEPAVADQVSGSELPADVAGQVTEALDRIEERLQSGESLRDIARGERTAAEDAARQLADRAEAARVEAEAARAEVESQLAEARDTGTQDIREQVRGLTTDLEDIASAAFESALGQTGDAGDELATGLAATAATAGAAAGAAVTARGRDALGIEADDEASSLPAPPSSLPAPPSSSLPAPPASALPAPASTLPAPPSVPEPPPPDLLADEPEPLVPAPEVEPEPIVSESAVGAIPLAAGPAPAPVGAQPLARTSEGRESVAITMAAPVIAPPPEVRPLAARAMPPSAPRTGASTAPSAEQPAEPVAEESPRSSRPPDLTIDSFSALRPPPAMGSRPAPAALRPTQSAAPSAAGPDAADVEGETEDTGAESDPPATAPPGPGAGFSLAPPPDYAALGASARE